ncbi:hypothetical protein HYU06_05580 [Candidatus Woesearchaeota archaeon]|nr:hypothetical protein [Candidatus Woesearchaeota archaeon]
MTPEEKLVIKFRELKKNIKIKEYSEEDKGFIKNCITLLTESMRSIRNKNYNLAYIGFCCVIEALAAKKYNNHINFIDWLTKNINKISMSLDQNNRNNYVDSIKSNYNEYNKTYGARRNFVSIFTNFYFDTKTCPAFIYSQEAVKVNRNGKRCTRIQWRKEKFKDINEALPHIEKEFRNIYDNYRSPLVHSGKLLHYVVRMYNKAGGHASPTKISVQSFGLIVLEIWEHNIIKIKNV